MKTRAFTLAEVLITLGIISIIASILLLTVIPNHQKKVWVNQLKSNYAILTNGFSKMANIESSTSLADSEPFLSLYGAGCGSNLQLNDGRCKNFFEKFKKTFAGNLQKGNTYKYSKETLNPHNKISYTGNIFAMQNGAIIFNYYFYPIGYASAVNKQGHFYIDTNGYKGPNVFGRDIFYFAVILDPPYIVPGGSKLCKQLTCTDFPYWRDCRGCCKKDDYAPMGFLHNTSCAGRIIEEGWEMNY